MRGSISSIAWNNERVRRISTIRSNRVRDVIAAALQTETFDPAVVASLATRSQYPDAARALVEECRSRRLNQTPSAAIVPALTEPLAARTTPCRVALAFDAITIIRHNTLLPLVTRDFLESIARRNGERAENARTALAAMGQPIGEWRSLHRRERAAFLLGEIVRAHRAGAAS